MHVIIKTCSCTFLLNLDLKKVIACFIRHYKRASWRASYINTRSNGGNMSASRLAKKVVVYWLSIFGCALIGFWFTELFNGILFSATYTSIDPDTLSWISWFTVWSDHLTFYALFMMKPVTWWAMTIIFTAGATTLVLFFLKPRLTDQ